MSEAAKVIRILPISQLKGLPLGRALIKVGWLTDAQVLQGLDVQKEKRANGVDMPLGEILAELGLITDSVCNLVLAAQAGNQLMYEMVAAELERDGVPIVREYPPQE